MDHLQISMAAARVNANLTQAALAELMGVTRATVINWENGKTAPGIPETKLFASIVGIPYDHIFFPMKST